MEEAVIFFLAVWDGTFSHRNTRWDTKRQTNVVPVGEMATIWETETHETVLGLDQRRQGCEAESHAQKR